MLKKATVLTRPTPARRDAPLPSKAAVSEEARRYVPHFVRPFARRMDLGEWKIPSSASGLRKTLFNVEPLSDARTPLGERRVSARRGRVGEKSDFSASC